jgi:hypothetical protein
MVASVRPLLRQIRIWCFTKHGVDLSLIDGDNVSCIQINLACRFISGLTLRLRLSAARLVGKTLERHRHPLCTVERPKPTMMPLALDPCQRNALNKGALREEKQNNNRRDHHCSCSHKRPPLGFDPAEEAIQANRQCVLLAVT